ncbi:sugar phosphate isomerase/epimerase [Patescibacteria group bacterium]|nr:sugar phosphate isomerase/epimerase [Patescibacteria group bacterium]
MSIKGVGINAHSPRINGDIELLERDLGHFKKIGFDYVEIPVHGVDGVINGKLNLENVKRVKEVLRKYNLKAAVHAPDPLNLRKDNLDLQKEVFQSSIEFASELEAKVLVYHGGNFERRKQEGELRNIASEREIRALKTLSEFADKRGVQICLENGALSIKELVMVVKKINRANIGVTYDFGHAFLYYSCYGGEKEFLTSIKEALPYLKHIHIHDNFGRANITPQDAPYINRLPFGEGDLHMPPGMGTIPYEKIFPLIREYKGIAMAEIDPRYEPFYGGIVKRLYKYIKEAHVPFESPT